MQNFKKTLPILAFAALATISSGAQAKQFHQNNDDIEGDYCREFTQTFKVGGEKEEGYGTACLQPDGSWKIISQNDSIKKQKPEVNYVDNEERYYDDQNEVIFTPAYHRARHVSFISYQYPPYHRGFHRHHGRHWR